MLLHINGNFTMGKLEIIFSVVKFRSYPPLTVNFDGGKSRYEAYLSAYVVSLISSSVGQMRSTKSPNLELVSERKSSI